MLLLREYFNVCTEEGKSGFLFSWEYADFTEVVRNERNYSTCNAGREKVEM